MTMMKPDFYLRVENVGLRFLSLRQPSLSRASGGRPPMSTGEGCLPKLRLSAGRLAPLWYVYFLELNNGDTYVGSTDDLRRRFASHQQGHVVSTSKYLPAVLRSYVAVADEVTARRLERYFKSGSGKAFAKKRFLQKSK